MYVCYIIPNHIFSPHLYVVLGLMVCHDFAFLAKSAVGSLFFVFLPAILLAKYYFKSTLSYYIAIYIPHFALIIVFGWRMYLHSNKLYKGENGPWSQHSRRMTSASASSFDELQESLLHAEHQNTGGNKK